MSEVNFTNLKADLENISTALLELAREDHMTEGEYNAFNGQIFYMEEKVQEIQKALESDPIVQVTYDPTKTDDGGDAYDTLILDALSTQEQTDGGAEGCSTSRTIYAHYATTDEADSASDAVEALGLDGVACEVFAEGGY